MQFKTLLVAFGLAAITNGAAIPESQLETRAPPPGAFKIRRFTPSANFDPLTAGTWGEHQYTNIASANKILNYNLVTADTAYYWTFIDGTLRGSASGNGGLAPRNLQSYEIQATPVTFGGVGEEVKVTIGPAPLHEVKFQTVRNEAPVNGWTAFNNIGGLVFLGKTTAVSSPVRFRAVGYTAPI